MLRVLSFGVVLLTFLFGSYKTSSPDTEPLCVEEFAVPIYPPLARQAGIQGTVRAVIQLDAVCHVTNVDIQNGHEYLRPSVTEALKLWQISGCRRQNEELAGNRTEDWTPTDVIITQSPYTLEITTSPYDPYSY